MKFKITIEDRNNGQVQVHCEPNFEVMAKIAKEKSDRLTPAAAYALGALAHIKKASIDNLRESLEERSRNGTLPLFNTH